MSFSWCQLWGRHQLGARKDAERTRSLNVESLRCLSWPGLLLFLSQWTPNPLALMEAQSIVTWLACAHGESTCLPFTASLRPVTAFPWPFLTSSAREASSVVFSYILLFSACTGLSTMNKYGLICLSVYWHFYTDDYVPHSISISGHRRHSISYSGFIFCSQTQ